MKIRVKNPAEITASEREAWMAIRAANPALYSPYFHIGYTDTIAAHAGNVRTAIAYDDKDTPIAFFPYQGAAKSGGFARPVGAPMTDYHGIIVKPEMPGFNAEALLRDAQIGALHYSAWAGSPQPGMRHNQAPAEAGCMMDISAGADAWREARDSSYSRHLKSHRRRVRKAEEEIGARRFEFASKDASIFDTLIDWKRQKFAQTGKYDVLSAGWTIDMLRDLWQNAGDLRCDMHALYFGDDLAAVDLGLTDGVTFHSWIVAYRDEHHSYAPGIQLLEGLIDAAADLGYSRIDLGLGLDGYKRHYATDDVVAYSGFAPVRGPAAKLSQLYGAAERFGEKSLSDLPGKLRRRYSQIAACDESFTGRARAMLDAVRAGGGTG